MKRAIYLFFVLLICGCDLSLNNEKVHIVAEIGYECALKGMSKEEMHKLIESAYER